MFCLFRRFVVIFGRFAAFVTLTVTEAIGFERISPQISGHRQQRVLGAFRRASGGDWGQVRRNELGMPAPRLLQAAAVLLGNAGASRSGRPFVSRNYCREGEVVIHHAAPLGWMRFRSFIVSMLARVMLVLWPVL